MHSLENNTKASRPAKRENAKGELIDIAKIAEKDIKAAVSKILNNV